MPRPTHGEIAFVSIPNLVRRIRSKLERDGTKVVVSWGRNYWYVQDLTKDRALSDHKDPESLGRARGVLRDWERLVNDGTEG